MRHNTTSDTCRNLANFLNDPLSQGIVTGALTLIPARNYPHWLRQTLVWGPPVAGGAIPAYLAMNPRVRRKLSARLAIAEHSNPSTRTGLRPQEPPRAVLSKGNRSTASMIATGTAIGAGVSLLVVGGFWADEKLEQGLRRLKVPFPRGVMAAAAGALTWWQLKQDQKRNTEDRHTPR